MTPCAVLCLNLRITRRYPQIQRSRRCPLSHNPVPVPRNPRPELQILRRARIRARNRQTFVSSRSKLISTALRRGFRKRCPHCGEGPLFSGWSQLERCSSCGLVFARNPCDTWAFTILGDRLPLGAIIVLIYFGVVRSHPVLGLAMEVVLVALLVWTAPNRWGAGIALHYLSRVYWPDPADPVPPPPAIHQVPTNFRPPSGGCDPNH
jgi:uncharacterized protein (DUF983 family)